MYKPSFGKMKEPCVTNDKTSDQVNENLRNVHVHVAFLKISVGFSLMSNHLETTELFVIL